MMNRFKHILPILSVFLMLVLPAMPATARRRAPLPCQNKVVAHRGGAAEAQLPDNSMASLRYAMDLGCYAAECDIYWTADDNILVTHADGRCTVGGLQPWKHTLAELRATGLLENGEMLPTLEDYLDAVMVKGSCTRLWLDIKRIFHPTEQPQWAINACRRACQIIRRKKAEAFVEFICTADFNVMRECNKLCQQYHIPIGWMRKARPQKFLENGYTWANLPSQAYAFLEGHPVEAFQEAGIQYSTYNVDRDVVGIHSAVSPQEHAYYFSHYQQMKAICTNHPKWLLQQLHPVAALSAPTSSKAVRKGRKK